MSLALISVQGGRRPSCELQEFTFIAWWEFLAKILFCERIDLQFDETGDERCDAFWGFRKRISGSYELSDLRSGWRNLGSPSSTCCCRSRFRSLLTHKCERAS